MKYKNGRDAKIGDLAVNQVTGAEMVVTSLHEKSAFHALKGFLLHKDDHVGAVKKPRRPKFKPATKTS